MPTHKKATVLVRLDLTIETTLPKSQSEYAEFSVYDNEALCALMNIIGSMLQVKHIECITPVEIVKVGNIKYERSDNSPPRL